MCTTKNDDTRRYPYMYVNVWHNNAWQYNGGMGIFTLYKRQPSHFPKPWRYPNVKLWQHDALYFAFFSTWPIQGWLSSKSTPTLITQFFASKCIKVELNSNHLKSFSQLQNKIKISDSGIRKNVFGSIFQRPKSIVKIVWWFQVFNTQNTGF